MLQGDVLNPKTSLRVASQGGPAHSDAGAGAAAVLRVRAGVREGRKEVRWVRPGPRGIEDERKSREMYSAACLLSQNGVYPNSNLQRAFSDRLQLQTPLRVVQVIY